METRVKAPITISVSGVVDGREVVPIREDEKYDQRKLTGQVDFIGQYPTTNIALNNKVHSGAITEGRTYVCIFERGNLKRGKNSPGDDEKTWNFYWNIVEFDIGTHDDNDLPWGDNYSAKDDIQAVAPASSNGATRTFDATAGQRYQQYCTNVRTALMQAREMHTVDGNHVSNNADTFELADEILGYLNSRTFAESPLAVKAVQEGAVPVEIIEKDRYSLDAKLDENWKIPDVLTTGKDYTAAVRANELPMDWVMSQHQKLGIAKSSDFVNAERGSYLDLLKIILLEAQNEGVGIIAVEEI